MKNVKALISILLFLTLNSVHAVAPGAIEGDVNWREKLRLLGGLSASGPVDPENMDAYLSDHCDVVASSVSNEATLRAKGMRRCRDLTVSFVQPDSNARGWEGKCGQTAASNLFFGFCSLAGSPSGYMNRYLRDITPGVRPDTLASGLDKAFRDKRGQCPQNGNWKWYHHSSAQSFINSLAGSISGLGGLKAPMDRISNGRRIKRSPLAVLIRTPGSHDLHWVTVVDVERGGSCVTVVNTWDNQYRVPCSMLAKWARGVSTSYPLIFRPYNIVVYSP